MTTATNHRLAVAGPRGGMPWARILVPVLVLCFAALGMPREAEAQRNAGAAAGTDRLVDSAWLRQRLNDADLRVLDASPAAQHRQQHIPGAVNVDPIAANAMGVTPARMQERMQSWGIDAGSRIVIYDEGGTWYAPKLFWDLLHHGVPAERLHLLDGGLAQWKAGGGVVTSEATPRPARGNALVGAVDDSVRVHLPEFLAATADPARHVLLEALPPSYFFGGAAFFDRAGHVPHATLMPSADLFNADKTFKSPAEIRRMLEHLGVRPDQTVHAYCGGGGAAAVNFFALKFLAGYPRVTLFQESQFGWLRDERQLPVWTYAAPQLLRDGAWVATWGGRMMRMMGLTRVTLVDLRAPEAWRQGHVPMAVNLPAAGLAPHRHEPGRVAERLGEAGIDAGHEAVLISDGGLTESAALAFLLLERAGQARVSLLLDPIERWAEQGREVDKPSSAAPATSAATTPRVAGAPPRFAGTTRGALVVSAPPAPTGNRVSVSVGAGPRSGAVAGPPSPHLLLSDLLQPDGSPRPAKDLWQAFARAGVPRYTPLVLRGDTPGQAAIGYVLFRLMGFPDLTVWLD